MRLGVVASMAEVAVPLDTVLRGAPRRGRFDPVFLTRVGRFVHFWVLPPR